MHFLSRLLLLCVCCIPTFRSFAQVDTVEPKPRLQISLLTCGPGSEIYSVFGHTAVRIVDSAAATDIVYNYGTFDGYDENFELNFMRGKLLYYLSEDRYVDFIAAYADEGRWVDEQILRISLEERKAIQSYLVNNLKPENRAYKYDFFFDNCATRIRDIFQYTHGSAFRFARVVPSSGMSFRQIINRYLRNHPWERLGINMLLGSRIDKIMSNADMMFLPDYLEDAVSGATLGGQRYAEEPERILKDKEQGDTNPDMQLVLWGVGLLLVVTFFVPGLQIPGQVLSSVVLLVTGFLGILMLFMWFGTDHQACAGNFNVLWALPTNLVYVFRRKQTKYAGIAIGCIFLSLLLHVFGVQGLLLPDMLPILFTLLAIFAMDYRKHKTLA